MCHNVVADRVYAMHCKFFFSLDRSNINGRISFKKMFFDFDKMIFSLFFFFFLFFFFYKGVHVTQKVQQVRQRVPANQVTHIFAWLRNKTTQSPRYQSNMDVLKITVDLF